METYEPYPGETIDHAARVMVDMANEILAPVTGRFNAAEILARPGDDPGVIVRAYHLNCDLRHEAWKRSPAGQKAMKEHAEFEAKAAKAREEGVLSFTLADAEAWQKFVDLNQDSYGSGVVRYAARWAHLVEQELERGRSLEQVADEASHTADVEGVTGFMYGCAVGVLAKVWKFGEDLRRWHNLKTQLRDEGEKANESGGVLNPALLCCGS